MPLNTPGYIHQLRKDREEELPAKVQRLHIEYFAKHPNLAAAGPNSSMMPTTPAPAPSMTDGTRLDDPVTMEGAKLQAQQELYQDMLHKPSTTTELQFTQLDQHLDQPQFFWWDYSKDDNTNQSADEFDFSQMQMQMPDEGLDPMDWSQWDSLLKEVQPSG